MKIGVVGTKTFNNWCVFENKFTEKYISTNIEKIIIKNNSFIDIMAQHFAVKYNILIVTFNLNKQFIDNSDELVAFWDGKSSETKYMIDLAKR
jgi:hypothetical protein